MNKVFLALVHNHNKERLEYIIPKLHGLKEWLVNRQFDTLFICVAYQSVITRHGRSISFFRDVIYQIIGFKWARYCSLKPSFLLSIAFLLRLVLRGGRYSLHGAWRRSSAIEVAVTDKHIRAWSFFLDSDADYLILFEDDAIFNEDSKLRLNNLLDKLRQEELTQNLYVDLAGGCNLDSLKVDQLLSSRDESFRYYKKPVTNTACAYLINKSLANHFHRVLTQKPWLRLIGVDWMMNTLFINLAREGIDCICMHAEPTIFKHGSTTGEYLPWAR